MAQTGIVEDPRGFPTWYHGPLSRQDAEQMIKANGSISGQFLMRCGSKGDSYVLTACSDQGIDHYQIREYIDSAGAPYLQFETSTGPSPKFGSLSSVLHYLLQHTEHLPAPLTAWIERPPEYEYDQPNAVAREELAYESHESQTKNQNGDKGDDAEYEEPVPLAPKQKRNSRANSLQVTLSLATLIRDTLASSQSVDIADAELLEESLYETVQQHPASLDGAPEVMIHSEYEVFAEDADTHEQVPVYQETSLKLLAMNKDANGADVVLCVDPTGRRLIFPLDSTVEVVPSSLVRLPSARAPPLPKRPEGSMAINPEAATPTTPKLAAKANRKVTRQSSLAELVKSAGGKIALTPATSGHPNVFYRDVLREGYLSKLPPPNNRVQAWKKRWFKLVVSLNRTLAGGPVFLEYYNSHKATRPKGIIDLDTLRRVGAPPNTVLESVKAYRSVPKGAVFEVELPRRTYRMLASSRQEADDWCAIIVDVLGSEGDSQEQVPNSPTAEVYNGVVLNQDVNNVDGQVIIGADRLTLNDPSTSEMVTVWEYRFLRSYGYIRNVCWFEAGKKSPSGPGIFCFSTAAAKDMFEKLHALVKPMAKGRSRHRYSRSLNMSWTSLGDEEPEAATPPRPKAVAKEVFGHALAALDLEPVALAVPLVDHEPSNEHEYPLFVGESIPILGSRAFVDQGYWLGQKDGSDEYGLVSMSHVEIHEHEFGNMRDVEDLAGSQDSLNDLDEALFALDTAAPDIES